MNCLMCARQVQGQFKYCSSSCRQKQYRKNKALRNSTQPKKSALRNSSNVLDDIVAAFNWYQIHDKRTLELTAGDPKLFLPLLTGDDRRIIWQGEQWILV